MNKKILIKTLPFLFSLNVGFSQTAAERLEQGVQFCGGGSLSFGGMFCCFRKCEAARLPFGKIA